MKNVVSALLKKYGSQVTLRQEEDVHFRAVLEPTTSLSWQNMRRQMRALGQVLPGQFLYLGDRDISRAEALEKDGRIFYVRRCEEISLGGETLYWWGLCVPAGEEAQWSI